VITHLLIGEVVWTDDVSSEHLVKTTLEEEGVTITFLYDGTPRIGDKAHGILSFVVPDEWTFDNIFAGNPQHRMAIFPLDDGLAPRYMVLGKIAEVDAPDIYLDFGSGYLRIENLTSDVRCVGDWAAYSGNGLFLETDS
jgi:hypothetical protein